MNVPYKTVTLQKGLLSTHTVLILLRNLEKQAKQESFFLKTILLECSPECFMLYLLFLLQLLLRHLEQTLQEKPLSWLWKKSFRKHVWSFLLVPPRLFSGWTESNLTQDTPQVFVQTNEWTAWVKKTNLSPFIYTFSQRLWKRDRFSRR